MCRLVESIKLENRQLLHIECHNERFNKARRELFGLDFDIDLQAAIQIPDSLGDGVYKCRVLYKEQIESIEFEAYTPRKISSFRLVDGGSIDYHLKYEDRSALAALVAQKGDADDVLIVKNGCITDGSYANIAFFNGKEWDTPDTYLLNGTQRQYLISEGVLKEERIRIADLAKYTALKPINAMLNWDETPLIDISQLIID